MNRFANFVGLAVGASLACLGSAQAQSVEQFYKGKNVTIVVPAAPGGGADLFVRAFAPHFARHIPGNPNIVVQNVVGAGGMKAAIQLGTTDPKDGTVIAHLQRNSFYVPLVSSQKVAFDARNVHWLGSLSKEHYLVAALSDAPVTKAEDLFSKTLRTGATAFGSENRTFQALMNEYFGTKFDIVSGYDGNAATTLAMERGEVKGKMILVNTISASNTAESGLFKAGKIKVVLQSALKRHPAFPDVPNILEFKPTDPDGMQIARFLFVPMDAGRPFAIPKGVPADRTAALDKAFMAAAADPAFLAEMAKQQVDIEPVSGREIDQIIAELYAVPKPVLDKIKKLIGE